jgi:hypothetical protein
MDLEAKNKLNLNIFNIDLDATRNHLYEIRANIKTNLANNQIDKTLYDSLASDTTELAEKFQNVTLVQVNASTVLQILQTLSIEQKNISDFTDEDDLIGLIYNNVNKMPISDIAKSGWMNDIDFLSETVSGLREVQHNFIEYSDIVDRQKDLEVPFRGYGI